MPSTWFPTREILQTRVRLQPARMTNVRCPRCKLNYIPGNRRECIYRSRYEHYLTGDIYIKCASGNISKYCNITSLRIYLRAMGANTVSVSPETFAITTLPDILAGSFVDFGEPRFVIYITLSHISPINKALVWVLCIRIVCRYSRVCHSVVVCDI